MFWVKVTIALCNTRSEIPNVVYSDGDCVRRPLPPPLTAPRRESSFRGRQPDPSGREGPENGERSF